MGKNKSTSLLKILSSGSFHTTRGIAKKLGVSYTEALNQILLLLNKGYIVREESRKIAYPASSDFQNPTRSKWSYRLKKEYLEAAKNGGQFTIL